MALLFVDGADHYATADGLKKWNAFGTGVTINSSAGRRGGGAIALAGSTRFVDKQLPSNYATLIVGYAFDAGGGSNTAMLKILDGATIHVALFLTAANAIAAYRGDLTTLLGTSANGVVPVSGYFYIEAKVLISDTVGTVTVRVNGVAVLTLTGLDTRNAGNASATGFRIMGTSATSLVDDIYANDTSGGAPQNDFLGDCRIDTLFPNADGSNSAWTPSTGTDHYALVDESTPNTTDYVETSGVGNKDTWNFQNLSAITGTIYGVQVSSAALKDDAGARSIANTVKSGATNADGATQALSTSQLYYMDIWATDPNTAAAWTEANVNAAEFGVKLAA
jgi:hypothetical protein